jgi:hypothetical protein
MWCTPRTVRLHSWKLRGLLNKWSGLPESVALCEPAVCSLRSK